MNLVLGTNQESMTSRDIAKITGTRHSHVLEKINGILNKLDTSYTEPNFRLSKYKDESGKKNTEITNNIKNINTGTLSDYRGCRD